MGQILQYFLTWTLFLSRLPPVHRLGHGRSGPDLQSADPDPDLLSDRGSSDGRPVRPRRLCCGHGLRQVHRQPAAQGEAHGSAPGPRDPDSSGPGSRQDFIYYYYLDKKQTSGSQTVVPLLVLGLPLVVSVFIGWCTEVHLCICITFIHFLCILYCCVLPQYYHDTGGTGRDGCFR